MGEHIGLQQLHSVARNSILYWAAPRGVAVDAQWEQVCSLPAGDMDTW